MFTDEIIRQVTLNCAERGHVLLMIRDEINMTVESYRGLYESVIGHGIRKVLLVSAIGTEPSAAKSIIIMAKKLVVRLEDGRAI